MVSLNKDRQKLFLIVGMAVLMVLSAVMLIIALSHGETEALPAISSSGSAGAENTADEVSPTDPVLVEWEGVKTFSAAGDQTVFFEQPDEMSKQVFVLKAGAQAIADAQFGEWVRVRAGAFSGWAKETEIVLSERAVIVPKSHINQPQSVEGLPIKAELDNISKKYSCVGVTAAFIKNGEVSYTYQYGYADKSSDKKMTADTKVRIASLSKVVVGMSAMSMQESGMLSLDDDISNIAGYSIRNPHYPNTPITMRHLLTHTSGLNDAFGYDGDLKTVLNSNKSYRQFKSGNENAFLYSNSAMAAAGALLEMSSGMTMYGYTEEWLFDRLGADASFVPSRIENRGEIATLYNEKGLVETSVEQQLNFKYSETPGENRKMHVGWLTASANDLAKVVCVLIGDGCYNGQYYMSAQTVKDMQTPYCYVENFDQGIILKHRNNSIDGRSLYYHTGNAHGVLSYLSYDESTGDGVVVITTGSRSDKKSGGVYLVCRELAECFYSELGS